MSTKWWWLNHQYPHMHIVRRIKHSKLTIGNIEVTLLLSLLEYHSKWELIWLCNLITQSILKSSKYILMSWEQSTSSMIYAFISITYLYISAETSKREWMSYRSHISIAPSTVQIWMQWSIAFQLRSKRSRKKDWKQFWIMKR